MRAASSNFLLLELASMDVLSNIADHVLIQSTVSVKLSKMIVNKHQSMQPTCDSLQRPLCPSVEVYPEPRRTRVFRLKKPWRRDYKLKVPARLVSSVSCALSNVEHRTRNRTGISITYHIDYLILTSGPKPNQASNISRVRIQESFCLRQEACRDI